MNTMRKMCQHARLRMWVPVSVWAALSAPMALAGTTFTIKPNARLDWDSAHMERTAPGARTAHGSELRRLWLGASGQVGGLDYKAVADLTKLEHRVRRDAIKMRDAWLGKKIGPGKLMLGQLKQAFSLDGETSSSAGIFIERANSVSPLLPGFRKAIGWKMADAQRSLTASVWRLQQIGKPQLAGFGAGTRLTFAPQAEVGDVRHLGLSLVHEHHAHPGTRGAPALRVRANMGAHLSTAARLDLARFSSGRAVDAEKWALEYARVNGAWSWQGEFSGSLMNDGVEKARIVGGYAALGFFVSGHTRRYEVGSGHFAQIKGVSWNSPAWELALRLDHVRGRQDAAGKSVRVDASATALTFASNWYVHPNLRLMLNVVSSHDRNPLTGHKGRNHELIGRVQYAF